MFQELFSLAYSVGTPVTLVLALLARIVRYVSPNSLAWRERGDQRARLRFANFILLAHLSLLVGSWLLRALQPQLAESARIGCALSGTLASVALGSIVLFEGIVARLKPGLPRIVPDLVTMGTALIALIRTSSQLGFEVSGVIATSAVLTAVIGLALQDTLGNALGGLALQVDRSLRVGDWIKINDISGCISEIHWRYTAVETNGWETVIIPNSMLMRSQVTVLGRRRGEPVQWRRAVRFEVDSRHAPADVVAVVDRALTAQSLPSVAPQPAPNCVAMGFEQGQTVYAARYWLTHIALDAQTESEVRNRIYYALARAQMELAVPTRALFVTTEDQAFHARKRESEQLQRITALKQIDLFAALSEAERNELAERLEHAPFARGEVVTREGAVAHHLYMIQSGTISVRVGGTDEQAEVARLGPGSIFGEMALLTGERRNATLIALTDVDCYRLDAEPFRTLLGRRADLAERVAQVLAEREIALIAAKQRLGAAQREKLRTENKQAFAARIRAFFELD